MPIKTLFTLFSLITASLLGLGVGGCSDDTSTQTSAPSSDAGPGGDCAGDLHCTEPDNRGVLCNPDNRTDCACECRVPTSGPDDCIDQGGVPLCLGDKTGLICWDASDPECSCRCTVGEGIEGADCTRTEDCLDLLVCDPVESTCRRLCKTGSDCPDANCQAGTYCGGEPGTGPDYIYVQVADLSTGGTAPSPGADIDGIVIVKPSGDRHPATSVQSFELGSPDVDNRSHIPQAVLGEPEASCESDAHDEVLSLGGDPGFVIVGFAAGVAVENGDVIEITEWGPTQCQAYENDLYQVAVGHSLDSEEWLEVGEIDGSALLYVEDLP